MSNSQEYPIERPVFFEGQRLTATDLTAVQDFHRRLRWLHNRSLHNWGIALGYEVSGRRGQRTVQVRPGYAVDCEGRELILSEPLEIAVPAMTSAGQPLEYHLIATYNPDQSLRPEIRTGACNQSGAVRRLEKPKIEWKIFELNPGIEITLASIQVQNCQLAEDVSGARRRNALPARQPYVAAGQTSETIWELWPKDKPEDKPVGVTATVSTAAAGFRTVPRYQAHVVGERIFQVSDGNQERRFIVDGYAQVAEATTQEFQLRMILPHCTQAGQSQMHLVTLNDYAVAVKSFLETCNVDDVQTARNDNGVTAYIRLEMERKRVNGCSYTLTEEDLKNAFRQIAEQYGTSIEEILAANKLHDTMPLQIGTLLEIPGPESLALNPPDVVLQDSFMASLRRWSVVWMGIEG